MDFSLKDFSLQIKSKEIKLTVEELLFCFQVNFYHLLSLLWSKSERKTTDDYCKFLLGTCASYLVKAAIVSDIDIQKVSESIYDSYVVLKNNYKNEFDELITMFNGEVENFNFDSISRLSLGFFLLEKKCGCSWKDILDTQNFDN